MKCDEVKKVVERAPYLRQHNGVPRVNADKSQARRLNSYRRGYDGKWAKAARGYRVKNPLCVCCKANGVIKPASVVDHVVPHKGDKALFWDSDNWQSLCDWCHNSLKAMIEARFECGHATKQELDLAREIPEFFDVAWLT